MITIVNFKAYAEATGKKAGELAKQCEKAAKAEDANVVLAVQATDIAAVADATSLPVLAQHVDAKEQGSQTGWITPEAIKAAGAIGSLVNHSEHEIPAAQIKETIARLKACELIAVVCAPTPEKAEELAKLEPDVIAIEPPELIGGDVSVSTAKPEIITQTTEKITDIPVLCGAGVKTKEDTQKAKELGAKGILVASGVVKAKDPTAALAGLVQGLK